MALIEDFKYDFFISYSHIDNEESNPRMTGWVEKFYNELNVQLRRSIGTRQISLWWDNKRLSGHIAFDDEIKMALENSAILICLNSPSFINSDYCRKELQCFHRHASGDNYGLKLNNRSRIFNVKLFNIPFDEWPEEMSGTTGFNFHNAKESEMGDRLTIRSSKFKNELVRLRDGILDILKEFPKSEVQPPPEEAPEFAIYFGDVADTLSVHKERTMNELRAKGYKVYSDVPPPFGPVEHEKAVMEKLNMASLNVHLLDQSKGKEIDGENMMSFPQKQLELSMQVSKPKIIWVPEELNIGAVTDNVHKAFLNELEKGERFSEDISYIRGKKSRLTQEIVDFAEEIKERKLEAISEAYSALLDIHFADTSFIMRLLANFYEEKIKTFLNPQEGNPNLNIQLLKNGLRQVKNLVFFYSQNSRDWVEERFVAAKQYMLDSKSARKKFLFFLLPPREDPAKIATVFGVPKINVIDNSFSPQLQNEALHHLLTRIKADA